MASSRPRMHPRLKPLSAQTRRPKPNSSSRMPARIRAAAADARRRNVPPHLVRLLQQRKEQAASTVGSHPRVLFAHLPDRVAWKKWARWDLLRLQSAVQTKDIPVMLRLLNQGQSAASNPKNFEVLSRYWGQVFELIAQYQQEGRPLANTIVASLPTITFKGQWCAERANQHSLRTRFAQFREHQKREIEERTTGITRNKELEKWLTPYEKEVSLVQNSLLGLKGTYPREKLLAFFGALQFAVTSARLQADYRLDSVLWMMLAEKLDSIQYSEESKKQRVPARVRQAWENAYESAVQSREKNLLKSLLSDAHKRGYLLDKQPVK